MRILIVSNLFLDIRFRKKLLEEIDTDIELDVLNANELIDYDRSLNQNIIYDLCIVWINLLIEYPYLEEKVMFNEISSDEAVQICKDYLHTIDSNLEYFAKNYIWIGQDLFFGIGNRMFPCEVLHTNLTYSLSSILTLILTKDKKILDINHIIAMIGLDHSYDMQRYWRWGNPYSPATEQLLIQYVKKILYRVNLSSPKCIVLDCDNVLWEGIVSEVGVNKIGLGNTGSGIKYLHFQHLLCNLYKVGIVICLCSKNEYKDVEDIFNIHSGMILKLEYISVSEISWNSKEKGILNIANKLNIELHDILFIDDTIAEVEWINHCLPEVQTMIFDKDNIYEILDYFDLDSNINIIETEKRQNTYKTNVKRFHLKSETITYEEYLKNLMTQLDIHKTLSSEAVRVSELSKRTNRCTIGLRYTTEEVKMMIDDEKCDIYTIAAKDIFGDMGIVGVYCVKNQVVELFCISCRAMGRNIEKIILEDIQKTYCYAKVKFVVSERNKWMIELLQCYQFDFVEV